MGLANSRVHYSITSSARASSNGGTVRPSALAVFKLITSSTLTDLLDRQVGRCFAVENAGDIAAFQAVGSGQAVSVTDQAAGDGKFWVCRDRCDGMADG